MIRVGLYGATGYSGFEAVKILSRHPEAEIVYATSEQFAGRPISQAVPWECDLELVSASDAPLQAADVAMVCLPQGVRPELIPQLLAQGKRVIDFRGDYRLGSVESYRKWYRAEHPAPGLLSEAVYGLPELYRDGLPTARLVANPGCYPTAAILGLYPLARAGYLGDTPVIVDAKSGISGAGRAPNPRNLFCEVNENVIPYSIGYLHRHIGEIEQELSQAADGPITSIFTPHLVPLNQGILCTMYVHLRKPLGEGEATELYQGHYRGERFVDVLEGKPAHLKYTFANNGCAIGLHRADEEGRYLIVTSAIDNLIKGASGQAVQCMNAMFGLPEDCGLV